MNPAWIIAGVLGFLAVSDWAKNRTATAAAQAQQPLADPTTAATSSLLNSLAGLLNGSASKSSGSGASLGGGSGGVSGGGSSGSSAAGTGALPASAQSTLDAFEDQTSDYDTAINATLGMDAAGNPIVIDTEDDNSADDLDSTLIPTLSIDDSYQVPVATFDPGSDPSYDDGSYDDNLDLGDDDSD
jgi:hypothetical protein